MNAQGVKLLSIKDLYVSVAEKPILQGLNIELSQGELHALMGPNGSGKSTLAQVIAGNEAYQTIKGTIYFDGRDLLAMPAEERACRGLFSGFQYPVEISGVGNSYFLKAAVNSVRKFRGLNPYDAIDFLEVLKTKMEITELGVEFLDRPLNYGFSGGEKKRNEILQMLVLEPRLAVLDEPDSGVDIDALKVIAASLIQLKKTGASILLITHYQNILNYLEPDYVHVLIGGQIVKSGKKILAEQIENWGYGWLTPN